MGFHPDGLDSMMQVRISVFITVCTGEKLSHWQSLQQLAKERIGSLHHANSSVIIIQNEAWWDPAQMPEVTYSEDLLSGIRSLKKNTVKGTFLSPVYAGGTCMPEFEVVTGIPTYFLPSSAYPYTQYITDQTPSIVSVYQQFRLAYY